MPLVNVPMTVPEAAQPTALRVSSPAKINLYLGVTGTRPDGYHELATIFERVELADELLLEPREDGITCACDHPAVPADDQNLVVRAAQRLQAACDIRRGLHITIRKRIPVAGGLGGGSSNAATVLANLNRWWRLGLSREQLMLLAREVGADVPFFIAETPFALGVGRGDVVLPIPTSIIFWHVLVTPDVRLSTADVFRVWDTLGSSAGAANLSQLAQLLSALLEHQPETAAGLVWNHLASASARLSPAVSEAEELLTRAGASAVSLSGSGPTMVATMLHEAEARRVATRVVQERPDWQVAVTRTATDGKSL